MTAKKIQKTEEEMDIEATLAVCGDLGRNSVGYRRIGARIGVHPDDMLRFIKREASLTAPARKLIRDVFGELTVKKESEPYSDG